MDENVRGALVDVDLVITASHEVLVGATLRGHCWEQQRPHGVGTLTAVHHVAPGPEPDLIVPVTSQDRVITLARVDTVAARSTANDVVTAKRDHTVVAAARVDDVVTFGSVDPFCASGADDRRRQPVAEGTARGCHNRPLLGSCADLGLLSTSVEPDVQQTPVRLVPARPEFR